MPVAPDLLLIDFDGVLADLDERRRHHALAQATGTMASDIAHVLAQHPWQPGPHAPDPDAQRCAALEAALAVTVTPAQWHAARMAATTIRRDCQALLLQVSRHTPVAVLSNNPAALSGPIAQALAIDALPASRVLTSGALGLRKPDPACFHAALGQLGASAARTLFIDNLFANVQGARSAGLQADTAHHGQSLRRVLKRFHLLR